MAEQEEKQIETEIKNESINEPRAESEVQGSEVASGEDKVDYYDQWLRCRAEFINYRRRMEEQLEERRRQVARQIVADLLPVIDDFNIFFHHHEGETNSVIDGVRMIYQKMMSIMKDKGLKELDPVGEAFDPHFHEAVMMEESDQIPEGNIVRVWQKGYLLDDALLRPAKVITAKAKGAKEVQDG
ncbi:MAG: nucleotide exchange factor GrpE [candidate division KSB1 bacterium]|nr:nucleotide exchange factor GrpE [candidate division KSB1 bacterium]MDZ7345589.1 nucleotide exchange factor GrpE [candidate division KSB1 bacterium]